MVKVINFPAGKNKAVTFLNMTRGRAPVPDNNDLLFIILRNKTC